MDADERRWNDLLVQLEALALTDPIAHRLWMSRGLDAPAWGTTVLSVLLDLLRDKRNREAELRDHLMGRAGRPPIVCLCGSGRFREAFERAEFEETLAGKIVLTIGCNAHDVARSADLAHHKPMLDELHLRKIDLADEVFIVNVGGYIGESTARELAYAREHGKVVRFLEPEGGS